MKTIKYLLLGLPLFFVMVYCYSCSNDVITESDVPSTEQCMNKAQEEEIQELITFVETLNANLAVEQVQTRGRFWNRIKRMLIGDAYGYGWGMQNGLPAKGGLITAAIFSIITAFDKDSSMPRIWKLNSDWKVYDFPRREYETIGNDHNKVIYNLMIEDKTIANGSFTNEYLCTTVNKKLMSYGYSYEISSLQRMELLAIIPRLQNCTTVEQLNDLMRQVAPTCMTEFQFVETYVDGLVSLNDKTSIRSYTQQINDEIDNTTLVGVVKSRLKTMVAIAECSKTLWIEIN